MHRRSGKREWLQRIILLTVGAPPLALHTQTGIAQQSARLPERQSGSVMIAGSCDELAAFALERGRIAGTELVAAGPFTGATAFGPPGRARPSEPIPEHCRVRMVLTPSSDSHINSELWLPTEIWNGKFLAVGNGGWAGSIQDYGPMQDALRRGYATAATDTGHTNELGTGQDQWMRLFLAPGMGHCTGGPGVNTFETLGIPEQWREQDVAPDEIAASNPQSGLAPPLCPYPAYAEHDGSGDLADAANWSCAAPE